MGEVYLAEDTRLDRRVALKLLRQESVADEQARKRLSEAKAAAALDHLNICAIYEVGEDDKNSFIVMRIPVKAATHSGVSGHPRKLSDSG